MLAPPYAVSPAAGRRIASATVGVVALALFTAAQPGTGDDVPPGTPSRAELAGWERVGGDVETTTMHVVYEFFVQPERRGLYTITRYRITHKPDGTDAGARTESEKYIWNVASGQPLRCFALETGGWRALAHATPEYRAEMLTAMSVYALHRRVTLARD